MSITDEEITKIIQNGITIAHNSLDECYKKLNKLQFNVDKFLTDGIGYNNLEQVKNSIKLGADINCKIQGGQSPLTYALKLAKSTKNFSIIEYLINNGSNINYICDNGSVPLSIALELKNIEIIKLLINKGSNINLYYSDKSNCLHMSIIYELKNIVEFTLKKYPTLIDSKNINGETPLFYAVERGNLEIIKILLNNGADIDIKRNDGLNVLTFGIKYEIINKVNIIKLFIQHYQKKFKFEYYSKIFDEALEYAEKLRLTSIISLFKDYKYEKTKREPKKDEKTIKIEEYEKLLSNHNIKDGETMATWLKNNKSNPIKSSVIEAYNHIYNKVIIKDGKFKSNRKKSNRKRSNRKKSNRKRSNKKNKL